MKITKIIFTFLLFANNLLYAQTLSLQNCINKAISTHPDIKRFVLQVEYSKSGVNVARSDYLPQVTLNAQYDPTITYALTKNGSFSTKDDDGWIAGVSLNQKIWDFSKTTSNIKAQKMQQKITKLSLQDAKALLAYKVKIQYSLMLFQKKAIKVRQKDLDAKEELYKQAQAFVEQGMKTTADASRFLSSVYIAKDNLSISKANFEKAKSILSLLINEPISKNVQLEDSISISSWDIKNEIKNEESMIQNSPAIKSLQKNIDKNRLSYKAVKASHYGSIDAVASYTHQDTLNEYDSTLVGVTLKIPLYSGGRTSALVEQAIINRQSAKAEYHSKELAFKEEFESLLIDLKRYEGTIKAKELQLEASQQTKTLLNARYKEGLSTYIEVLDAIALTLDAQLGVLQAKFERSSTIHRLEYLQGKAI
jgi:outer membrane protein TolC